MSIAVCPGSFDPVTYGHIDIFRRASLLFDEIIVAVGENPSKEYMFTSDERAQMIRTAVTDIPGVRVDIIPGLLSDYCRDIGAQIVIKGVRSVADYSDEETMALLNYKASNVETMFMPSDPSFVHIASRYVKELASYGADVSEYVPFHVSAAIKGKLSNSRFV
ncbi:MAG: pantetheine-phosphate adenylyltransferase [Actinomycetaceae bacterium]|nr:pantetheine-phosphate adenylyltransferase [Actinomycetaceae bacterium]